MKNAQAKAANSDRPTGKTPEYVTEDNVDGVKAQLIIEGAYIPARAAAETALHDRGVLVVPDFIANAGGVICASVEYHGGTEATAFHAIEEKIRRNTNEVLKRASDTDSAPRTVARALALERVREAMGFRRFT